MKKLRALIPHNHFLKIFLVISSFVFAVSFIPVIGSIILILLPVILFFNGTINGRTKTALAFFISCLLLFSLSVVLHLNLPTIAIFTMGIAGLLIAQIAAQNGSVEKIIIYPSLFIITAIWFFFIYSGFALSVNPWHLVQKFIATIIEANVKFYSQLPLKTEDINFIKDNQKNLIDGITQIFPALVIVAATFIVWINFLLGKQILAKAGITCAGFTALAGWKAPESIIWIFILCGGLFFVPYKDISFFCLNIFLIICFIYLLQGLAIVSFFFQNKNVPLFLRYMFYFLIAVQQILVIPIVAIGLFDIWVDFRKYLQKDQEAT